MAITQKASCSLSSFDFSFIITFWHPHTANRLVQYNSSCQSVQINDFRHTVWKQINYCLNTRLWCPLINRWEVLNWRCSVQFWRFFFPFLILDCKNNTDLVTITDANRLLSLNNTLWTSEIKIIYWKGKSGSAVAVKCTHFTVPRLSSCVCAVIIVFTPLNKLL